MVEDIETELQHLGQGEVPSEIIGEMVMERLISVDRVAYIRYASVYRDFQDIESFERVVKDLREDETRLSLPRIGIKSAQRNVSADSKKPNKYGNKTPMIRGQVNLSA